MIYIKWVDDKGGYVYKSRKIAVLLVALLLGCLVNSAFASSSHLEKSKDLKVEVFSAKIGMGEGDIVHYFDLEDRVAEWFKSHPKVKVTTKVIKVVDGDGRDLTYLDLSNPRMRVQGVSYTIVVLYTEK